MNLSKEEFQAQIKEDQQLVLELLAENEEITVDKFYKVAGFLEYLNLFSGVLFSIIKESDKKQP